MSREWDGVDDLMTYPPVTYAFGTTCVLAKILNTNDAAWLSFIEGETSGGALNYAFGRNNSGTLYLANQAANQSAVTVQDADLWAWYFSTKATGTSTPTMHKIPVGGARTSTAAGSGLANHNAIPGGRTRVGGNDDFFNGRFAAVALLDGVVLTTGQIDTIVSTNSTQAIIDAGATWCVDDSDGFATDLVGSNDRTAIVGTADSADDPAAYTYFGAAAATGIPSLVMAPPIAA